MLETSLRTIGLGEYESRVYACLLRASPAGASLIAKKCGLPRSTVYTVLSTLIAKGLVGTSYRNNVKQFIAQGSDALSNYIKQEEEQLENKKGVLPKLIREVQTLHTADLHLPNVTSFEGQEGLKKIYMSMLREAREGSTMHIIRDEFVWSADWKFVFQDEWHSRVKDIQKKKEYKRSCL